MPDFDIFMHLEDQKQVHYADADIYSSTLFICPQSPNQWHELLDTCF